MSTWPARESVPSHSDRVTGLVLAGGQGSRMQGRDKGLVEFQGQPLAQRAMDRLRPQVGRLLLSANRNKVDYERFGVEVLGDSLEGFQGPLAGMLVGLEYCATPWLQVVPCDVPFFPLDLVERLVTAAERDGCVAAYPLSPSEEGRQQRQPVFLCVKSTAVSGLRDYLSSGGRKIDEWVRSIGVAQVSFDSKNAFANANTLDELEALSQGLSIHSEDSPCQR